MKKPAMQRDVAPLREVLHNTLVRYIGVKPGGMAIDSCADLRRSVDVRILSFGGARTLYSNRKPICRSLDGLRPVTGDTARACRDCVDHVRCTPQVRLDLIVERRARRLLLAHTSARAFLVYDAELRQRRVNVENVRTKITVVNRGHWGELRFSALD